MMRQRSSAPRALQIIAATIGNAFEWYDFLVFGYLTAVVSKLFFPSTSEYCSLLATTATFAVGFIMRPVGGVLLGMYGDRFGRKAAMQLIIVLSTISMALIAFAPTYAAIGIGAPLLVVLARLIQGFATGGEFASSTAFLVEYAPASRKGLYGSWQNFGQCLAMIGGTAMGALITGKLSPEALSAWGWRVPFIVGMLIAPVGFWIRRHVEEPDTYIAAKRAHKVTMPLREVFSKHRRGLLVCLFLTTSGTMCTYIQNVYMPTFASKHLGVSLNQAFTAQMFAGLAAMLLIPLFGALSDWIGRRKVLFWTMSLYFLTLYPMFAWTIAHKGFANFIVMAVTLSVMRTGYAGVMSTVLAEQFPTAVRSTGMSVAYNVAVMVFGGTAQFVVTWLIGVTGTPLSAAGYLMFATLIGIVSVFFVSEPRRLEVASIDLEAQYLAIGEPVSVK